MHTPLVGIAARLANHNHPRSSVPEGLRGTALNSKSLPNIPTAVNRLVRIAIILEHFLYIFFEHIYAPL